MHIVSVRRLRPKDWRLFRDLRLASLAEAPHAFCSTLAEEQEYDEARWRSRLGPGGPIRAVAFVGDEPAGITGAWLSDDGRRELHLLGMWVAPRWRRHGVGDALVREVLTVAHEQQPSAVMLWVVSDNQAARRLYERHGFQAVQEYQPHGTDPTVREQRMRRGPTA
ncbi:MAG: GNAT family N-acetyltransferase [Actinomycetota bacterium]|jgi:ribosomal protein S18 acetylase RimI-like enzyme|nr:GNAT family N-acetyltransferase [Actinomycetota bacterium]MDQ3422675.1 GNAT family N-acetyltransferase [Actinomycetota bacterium]